MRVAVIGCGAIADTFHLPALGRRTDTSVVLVDSNADRAAALARKHGASGTARAHDEVLGRIDAAIIATPHHTHVPIALDCLAAGVPVLSEKPLGTSVAEVQELMDTAHRLGLPVGINHTRRFIPACREIKRLLTDEALGEVRTVEVAEGDRFGWPAATPAMFGRRSDGKGVLLDIGVHVIDLFTWWFGDGLRVETYRDDSFGGSEAAAQVRLASNGVRLSLGLSWLVKQQNRCTITGTAGVLEWGVYDLNELTLRTGGSDSPRKIRLRGGPAEYSDLAGEVLDDFFSAIATGGSPAVTPRDALPSMQIIETCYRTRERFDLPWHDFREAALGAG